MTGALSHISRACLCRIPSLLANFMPGMQILFAGVPATNITLVDSEHAWVETPRMNLTSGYVNTTLLNPDGGYTIAIERMVPSAALVVGEDVADRWDGWLAGGG